MIYERSGLFGLVVAILVPAIAFWLKSMTTQAAQHNTAEDQREGEIQAAYVSANKLRDTQMNIFIKEIHDDVKLMLLVVNMLPELIRSMERKDP